MNKKMFHKNQKGAALITVLALFSLIASVLPIVSSDIGTEYAISSQKLHKLKAKYNARAAMEISFLKILIYKETNRMLGEKAKLIQNSLNQIWSIPFMWPLPIPEDLLESEKKELKQTVNDSFIKGSFSTSIQPSDGRIDINDLSSPISYLRKFTFNTLYNLLLAQKEKEDLNTEDITKMLYQLTDWLDTDAEEAQGGGFEDFRDKKPPQRSLVFIEELKKLPTMTETFYRILEPHITTYGSKGLNINYLTPEIFQALGIPEEFIANIMARISPTEDTYNPFRNKEDFCQWMEETLSLPLCEQLKSLYQTNAMLQFNTPLHFQIQASGAFRNSFSEIESLTYDVNQTLKNYKNAVSSQKRLNSPEEIKENKEKKQTLESEEFFPYRVFSPLVIIYWKESL